jgi:Ca-activated chloride channel family protein
MSLILLGAPVQPPDSPPDPNQGQPPAVADQTSPSDEGFRIGVAVNQVFLSVNVRGPNGFVRDLTVNDFAVFEDGHLQKVVNFYRERVPVRVVLLIDISGSTTYTQADIRHAALLFAKSLSPEDQVAIITFNHQPRLILNWTNKLEDIQLALESIYARGNTALNDAIYVTFDDLLRDVEGKTAVILLTDGIDTGSTVSFEEAVDLALRSDTMVYVVSKLEEYWAQAIAIRQELQAQARLVPKVLQDDYILERKRALNRLASLTGGRVLDTRAFGRLEEIYAQVAEELKNQYYLSYIPSNQNRDGTWREIEVQVARGGVAVSTRRGYYAPLPSSR